VRTRAYIAPPSRPHLHPPAHALHTPSLRPARPAHSAPSPLLPARHYRPPSRSPSQSHHPLCRGRLVRSAGALTRRRPPARKLLPGGARDPRP
jgi:hypothetical protein